jgi:hypothetical protein
MILERNAPGARVRVVLRLARRLDACHHQHWAPVYHMHKESRYQRSDVVRWFGEQGVTLQFARASAVEPTRGARSGDARPVTRSSCGHRLATSVAVGV